MSARARLLSIQDFSLDLQTDSGPARVLDHIDLTISRGEIVGLVGESGCGKTTLVKAILGIMPEDSRAAGRIELDGEDLLGLDEATLGRRVRASRIGFVPQDPYQALNPLFRVGNQILEVMRWRAPKRFGSSRRAHRKRLIEILAELKIPDAARALQRYPHEFSGGQLQRLTIACAMACDPDLIVADEPTSALDVTTQEQILHLLEGLARERGIALLLVTHDLGLVARFCDRVVVMYAGQSIETASVSSLLVDARHPYSRLLLDCHPDRNGALKGIPGVVPPLTGMPGGCRFAPRCPNVLPICPLQSPLEQSGSADGTVRCWATGEGLSGAASAHG